MIARRGHWLSIIVLSVLLLGALPAPADPPPGTTALTLNGPAATRPNVATTYTGSLTLFGLGSPNQVVELLVNGSRAASTTTNLVGNYVVNVTFTNPGNNTLQAVAYRGTGLETRSIPRIVAVQLLTFTGTSPASRANNNNPRILGTAEPGRTVVIYTNNTCTSTVAGSGPATGGNFSISVTVPDNTTTTFFGKVTDASGNPSACSSSSVTYTEDSQPPSFDGLTSAAAISPSSIRLTWQAASDTITPPTSTVYDICMSTVPGSCASNFTIHQSSAPGVSGADVTGLDDFYTYFFVVRARDQAGNRDSNTVEKGSRTLGPVAEVDGGHLHSCVLISDGTVGCWGNNTYGQLGDGTGVSTPNRVMVSGLTDAVSIATGHNHTCALISGGTARCWGQNTSGALGDGTTTDRSSPVFPVTGLSGAIAITAGWGHSCALLSDGTARCWGGNASGQLGDGTTTDRSTPVTVNGLSSAVAIAAGGFHTCALLSDGTARCWGDNDFGGGGGWLGNGTTTDSSTPVTVSGLTGAVAIATDTFHTCAVRSDGTARCWGGNSFGQLGNGTTASSSTPVVVTGLTGAVAVSTGSHHTCTLHNDGSARCWGRNFYGQLGNGTTSDSSTAVQVNGLSGAVVLGAGVNHACSVLSGRPYCWGQNGGGQLGNGDTTDRHSPAPSGGF